MARKGGNRKAAKRRPFRRLILFCITAAVGYVALCAGLVWYTLRPRQYALAELPGRYGLIYGNVSFVSADGTRLAGWLIPAKVRRPRGLIILCHGVDGDRTTMLPTAQILNKHGYAVLMFDFRARGESSGSLCSLGYHEVDDLGAAIRYVQSRQDTRRLPIGVLGQSLGASVALICAAGNPQIRAVVAESPFTSLDRAVSNHFACVLGPAAPALSLPVTWIGERVIGCSCSEVSPISDIARISPRPVLLIQDESDPVCPPEQTNALMAAAREPKQLWQVPGAGHIQAEVAAPRLYAEEITRFFDSAQMRRAL
ncbi:MAG TPA: alpha/beta hydrolase [Chthonomonadales bacterium]|nr:alpha/beta hydrolase [Chthonomonadales bacterium]